MNWKSCAQSNVTRSSGASAWRFFACCSTGRKRGSGKSELSSGQFGDHGHVLVATAAEIDQHDVSGAPVPAVTDYPGDGVGALQGRENSLQPGQVREGVQCLPISHCFIQYATRVLQVSMLGPDPWIIEPGRHAVGRLHLAVRVLE